MLDLLTPSEAQRRSGVAIEEEPNRLCEELGLGVVAPVHRYFGRLPVDDPGEPTDAPLLVRVGCHTVDPYPETLEQDRQLVSRRKPQWRAHDEMDDRDRPPTDGEAGEDGNREARAIRHGGQGEQTDAHRDAALEPAAEVRQRGERHPDGHRDLDHRKVEIEVLQGSVGGTPARRTPESHEHQTPSQREGSRHPDVAHRGPSPRCKCERGGQGDDSDRTRPPDRGDQPPDPGWWRGHRGCDDMFGMRIGVIRQPTDEDRDSREADPKDIAAPAPGLPVTDRSEHGGSPRSVGPRRWFAHPGEHARTSHLPLSGSGASGSASGSKEQQTIRSVYDASEP